MLMCYEATRDLPLEETEIETPMGKAVTRVISRAETGVCADSARRPRAWWRGVLTLVPAAKVGHIGLYRDHQTLQPVEYYHKLPQDIKNREVILLDPMLATGGSAIDAISIIKRSTPKGHQVHVHHRRAGNGGIEALTKAHPDVQIYCAAVTITSTRTAISCPVSAMRAIASSARSDSAYP